MLKYIFATAVLLIFMLTRTESADPKNDKADDMTPSAGDQDDMDDVDIMTAISECNETFRIEMSYLLALNQSGSFPDETDKTPKCYVRCVLEMTNIASNDGKFDPSRAEVALMGLRGVRTLSNVEETAVTCGDRKESCKCERSYQFIKCLMEMEIKMSNSSN